MNAAFSAVCEAAAIEWSVPALAVGVAAGDETWTHAVGCEPATRFRVASITKPFTATLALGLLDPEERTGVWPDDVRIRHLLSHTSGFDCERGEAGDVGEGDDALGRVVAFLPGVRRFVGVEQVWSYANTGYWLAGHLAAVRAGATFEDALAERVLGPAGLEATAFDAPDLPGTGEDANDGHYPRARRPSGGLVSNVPDLLRFGRRHLADPHAARMRIVHGKPPGGVYGLGLFGERVGETEVWGHAGSWGGYQSSLLVVPDRSAVLVGLTNASNGRKALQDVEDAFFELVLGRRRRVAPTVELDEAHRDAYAGAYANSDGWYEARTSGDGMAVTLPDGEYSARAIGERTFEIVDRARRRERFDFPLEGFGRFGGRLAERVA